MLTQSLHDPPPVPEAANLAYPLITSTPSPAASDDGLSAPRLPRQARGWQPESRN